MAGASNGTRRGMLLVAASAICFGSLAIFGKLGNRAAIPISEFLGLRFGVAALLLWLFLLLRREGPWLGWRPGLGMAAMGILYTAQATAYFISLRTAPAAVTSILLYAYPVLVAVLARVVLKEAITPARAGALVIAVGGVFLVVDPLSAGAHVDLAGVGFGLASAIVYATYIVAGPRLIQGSPAPVATAYIATVAGLCFLTAAGLTGNLQPISGKDVPLVIGMAVVATVIPASLFLAGLRLIGPTRAAILSTLEPATTVLLAGLVLGESLGALRLAGGLAVLAAGVVIAVSGRPAAAIAPIRE